MSFRSKNYFVLCKAEGHSFKRTVQLKNTTELFMSLQCKYHAMVSINSNLKCL
jgi:hypothetical protein